MTHILLFDSMDVVGRSSVARDSVAPLHHLFRSMMDFSVGTVRASLILIGRAADLKTSACPLSRGALAQNAGANIEVAREGFVSEGVFIILTPVD
ncbi:hypothetical protein SDC9_211061 [bioreactor metagenome]|uniref:Uncharacterized protein n=1 Tax=bioreactor metagenome TaxID=1076179 RepID=A0A645JVR0_9ZZZZ